VHLCNKHGKKKRRCAPSCIKHKTWKEKSKKEKLDVMAIVSYDTFKVKTKKMRMKNIERKMGRPRKKFGCHCHNILLLNPKREA
jgi:hypothetical protein